MKKLLFVLVIASLVLGNAFAFDFMKASPAAGDQKININLGVGIGSPRYGDYIIPPVSATVSYRLDDMIGIPLSVGGFFGMTSYGWERIHGGTKFQVEDLFMAFGLRANWHFTLLDFMDTYIGVTLGYFMNDYTRPVAYWDASYNVTFKNETIRWAEGFFYGGCVGMKFFFIDNLGLFLEVGYSALSFATIGVALKF